MQIYKTALSFENKILLMAALLFKRIKTGMCKNPLSIAVAGSGIEIKILCNIWFVIYGVAS